MKYTEAAHMAVTENPISHTSIHLQVLWFSQGCSHRFRFSGMCQCITR